MFPDRERSFSFSFRENDRKWQQCSVYSRTSSGQLLISTKLKISQLFYWKCL